MISSDKRMVDKRIGYETIVILKSSVTDEEVLKTIDKMKDALVQKSGEVIRIENMGRKRLAYDVKKEKRGVFILIHFTGCSKTVFEIQRIFKLDEMVIKYMTVKMKMQDLQSVARSEAGSASGEETESSVDGENS